MESIPISPGIVAAIEWNPCETGLGPCRRSQGNHSGTEREPFGDRLGTKLSSDGSLSGSERERVRSRKDPFRRLLGTVSAAAWDRDADRNEAIPWAMGTTRCVHGRYPMVHTRVVGLCAGAILLLASCQREQRLFRVAPWAARRRIPEANAYAVGEGQRLFVAFNCVGCHAHGGGGIGLPDLLADRRAPVGFTVQVRRTNLREKLLQGVRRRWRRFCDEAPLHEEQLHFAMRWSEGEP